jgi:tetratricopeptide (TPR) repeat protein
MAILSDILSSFTFSFIPNLGVHTLKSHFIMKKISTILALSLSLAAFAQEDSELAFPPNGDNEKAEVSQWIGLVKITITYHSPNVHGPAGQDRKGHIWGELVHYGFVDQGFGPSKSGPWRAGANESTTVSFSHDVTISSKVIKAGTYALFLDVEKDNPWNWILSSNIGWGSYQYDPRYDVLRIPAQPEEAPYTEWLTYGFDERNPNSTIAYLHWENKKASFRIEVPKVDELYLVQMRHDLQSWAGFNYQNWQSAAAFCVQKNINLDEALDWADKAINDPFRGATFGKADFSTYSTKAQVLTALGRDAEADAIMDAALKLPGTEAFTVYLYSRSLLNAGKKERALKVALLNQKNHPDEPFWTHLGMARSYAATGDRKNAIKSWKLALKDVPVSQKQRIPQFESELKKLEEGS